MIWSRYKLKSYDMIWNLDRIEIDAEKIIRSDSAWEDDAQKTTSQNLSISLYTNKHASNLFEEST